MIDDGLPEIDNNQTFGKVYKCIYRTTTQSKSQKTEATRPTPTITTLDSKKKVKSPISLHPQTSKVVATQPIGEKEEKEKRREERIQMT